MFYHWAAVWICESDCRCRGANATLREGARQKPRKANPEAKESQGAAAKSQGAGHEKAKVDRAKKPRKANESQAKPRFAEFRIGMRSAPAQTDVPGCLQLVPAM